MKIYILIHGRYTENYEIIGKPHLDLKKANDCLQEYIVNARLAGCFYNLSNTVKIVPYEAYKIIEFWNTKVSYVELREYDI